MKSNYSIHGVDTSQEGWQYQLLMYMKEAMEDCKCSEKAIARFLEEATRGNDEYLLSKCKEMVKRLNSINN